ncbi:unnamed protein product, partial [Phaeothamnion confervicola]
MYVWEAQSRRYRRRWKRPPPELPLLRHQWTRSEEEHELWLQELERQRGALEEREVKVQTGRAKDLIEEYVAKSAGGKAELAEVTAQLLIWKANTAKPGDCATAAAAAGITEEGRGSLEDSSLDLASTIASSSGPTSGSTDENASLERRRQESRRRKARAIFDMFDADASATIDGDELRNLMNEMCVPLTKGELAELMDEIDADGSGEIDFEASGKKRFFPLEFYAWFKNNAASAQRAKLGKTASLFAGKLLNAISGLTARMEAMRIVVAHAQAEVERRQRAAFRRRRPPRFCCPEAGCVEAFASEAAARVHRNNAQAVHEAAAAARAAARRRFEPVTAVLNHPDPVQARRCRLRRTGYSDAFYMIYGANDPPDSGGPRAVAADSGEGSGGDGSGGGEEGANSGMQLPGAQSAPLSDLNKVEPQVEDPEDRRGAQLRRGMAVEGFDPTCAQSKWPLATTSGGFKAPAKGSRRRGRWARKIQEHGPDPLQRALLALALQPPNFAVVADSVTGCRARAAFCVHGEVRRSAVLFGSFNGWRGELMRESPGKAAVDPAHHQTVAYLAPGTYFYYFEADGRRVLNEAAPVGHDDAAATHGACNVLIVAPGFPHRKRGAGACAGVFISISENRDASAAALSMTSVSTAAGALVVAGADEEPPAIIDLTGQQICDDGAAALAAALHGCRAVRRLWLSHNRISSAGAAWLAQSLGASSSGCSIADLNLSCNGLGYTGARHLAAAFRYNSSLTALDVADNALGDDGTEALCQGLHGHPQLRVLKLDRNRINYDGTAAVAKLLLHNHVLTALCLRENRLMPDSVAVLTESLRRNGALKRLDLGRNPLGPDGLHALSAALTKGNDSLAALGLQGCGVEAGGVRRGVCELCARLAGNRGLAELDLSANGLGAFAAQELANALLKNKSLTILNLGNNPEVPAKWLDAAQMVESEVYASIPTIAASLARNAAVVASGGAGGNGESSSRGGSGSGSSSAGRMMRRSMRQKWGKGAGGKSDAVCVPHHDDGSIGASSCEPSSIVSGSVMSTFSYSSIGNGDGGKDSGGDSERGEGSIGDESSVQTAGMSLSLSSLLTTHLSVAIDGDLTQSPSLLRRAVSSAEESSKTSCAPAEAPAMKGLASEAGATAAPQPAEGEDAMAAAVMATRKRIKHASASLSPSQEETDCLVEDTSSQARQDGTWTQKRQWAGIPALTGVAKAHHAEVGLRAEEKRREKEERQAMARAAVAAAAQVKSELAAPNGLQLLQLVCRELANVRRAEGRSARTQAAEQARKAAAAAKAEMVAAAAAVAAELAAKAPRDGEVTNNQAATTGPSSRMAEECSTSDGTRSNARDGLAATAGKTGPVINRKPQAGASTAEVEGAEKDAAIAVAAAATAAVDAAAAAKAAVLEEAELCRFCTAFEEFDPTGLGVMRASDLKTLLLVLLLPVCHDTVAVEALRKQLVEESAAGTAAAAALAATAEKERKRAEESGGAARPLETGLGKTDPAVTLGSLWRWHRREQLDPSRRPPQPSFLQLHSLRSEAWRRRRGDVAALEEARRLLLAVAAQSAAAAACAAFRADRPPRFLCAVCKEVAAPSQRRLAEHTAAGAGGLHEAMAACRLRFERAADVAAAARWRATPMTFPDFYGLARHLPPETEVPMYEAPDVLARPLGTITGDMLVRAVMAHGDWVKVDIGSTAQQGGGVNGDGNDAWVRMRSREDGLLLQRMQPGPAAATSRRIRTNPTAAAAAVACSAAVATSALMRRAARHVGVGGRRGNGVVMDEGPELPALAPGVAAFKPYIVVLPRPVPFCLHPDVPAGGRAKVRVAPADGARVLGTLPHGEAVLGAAMSGDWLQIRYGIYSAAWVLARYRGKAMM